ncbi:MAG: glycogen debranching protein, partial [Actinomycetota bacterium]
DHFLGIRPDAPGNHLYAVPHVPEGWPGLSIENLRVGSGTMSASASHDGSTYETEVSAPAGWTLTIGHTLPRTATVSSVTLDGSEVEYTIVDSARGREVQVQTDTGAAHTLVVTAES